MSVTAKFLEGKKFEVVCRSHKIIADQPKSDGGTDQGMSPVELLNASIASCAAYYAMTFLSRRIPDLTGLRVECSWQYSEDPHRVGSIDLIVILPRKLSELEERGLLRSVSHCTVKNTLEYPPTIRTAVSTLSGL